MGSLTGAVCHWKHSDGVQR